jgi:hypothetical protein
MVRSNREVFTHAFVQIILHHDMTIVKLRWLNGPYIFVEEELQPIIQYAFYVIWGGCVPFTIRNAEGKVWSGSIFSSST